MFEFGIFNGNTAEIIFGYNFADACKRHNLNPADWQVDYVEFID